MDIGLTLAVKGDGFISVKGVCYREMLIFRFALWLSRKQDIMTFVPAVEDQIKCR